MKMFKWFTNWKIRKLERKKQKEKNHKMLL